MFPKDVIKKLKFYIYLYIHPDTGKIFYVGKGKENRAFQHLNDDSESQKAAIIKELKLQGKEPLIDILIHGIQNEATVYKIEAAVIDLIGKDNLTNRIRGWRSGFYGRMPYQELISMYSHTPATITEPSILIRINELYHFGLSPIELYDVTRGRWKVGKKRDKAKYAFSVYDSVVKEVYEIKQWLPSGSTFSTRSDNPPPDRWEFIGKLAEKRIRDSYLNKSVGDYFPKRAQNPIMYLNIEDS
tara:strand:+ start:313 stop:1041 length:729 start_codon:yes stop_codon:yes gene_type:complete